MSRSKQNKGGNKGGEKYRKETKQERRDRLKQQEEARENCFKVLPYVGGVIAILIVMFGIWVRSVPPKPAVVPINLDSLTQGQFQAANPDFMNVDTEPMVKEALDEAAEVLDNLKNDEGGEGEKSDSPEEPVETIEL